MFKDSELTTARFRIALISYTTLGLTAVGLVARELDKKRPKTAGYCLSDCDYPEE